VRVQPLDSLTWAVPVRPEPPPLPWDTAAASCASAAACLTPTIRRVRIAINPFMRLQSRRYRVKLVWVR